MIRISLRAAALVLSAATWASAQSPTPRPVAPATPAVPKAELIAATEIVGTVITPDGKPAAKARVGLLPATVPGKAPAPPMVMLTDEQGAFRFDVRGLTSFSLRAQLSPYAMVNQTKVTGGRRVTLKLESGERISGQVVDLATNLPLANVSIEAAEWDDSPYSDVDPNFGGIRGASDTKGRFTLMGVSSGSRLTIRARLRGYAAASTTSIPPTGLKFRLQAGRAINGLVTDAAGRPVASARVLLRPSLASTTDNLKLVSNAAGRFEASGLRMTPYDLTVLADGFAPSLKDALGVDTTSVTIPLERTARVTGRFVDDENKPIKGVVRLRAWSSSEKVPSDLERLVTAATKADGTFELTGLRAGSNSIELRADDYSKQDRKVEIMKAGDVTGLGDVKFEKGLTLRGRVTTAGEVPVPGARVQATRGVRSMFNEQSISYADADTDGRFELKGLSMESYQIAVTAEGFARQTSKSAPSDEILSIIMNPVVRLTGRIVDGESAPVARARLNVQKGPNSPQGGGVSISGGRFSVELGESGEMQLTVTAEGFKVLAQTIQAAPNADLGDLVLSRGLKVRGTVVDSRGSAVAGARVEDQTIRQFPPTSAETDDKGQFEITGIAEGRTRLSASHPQFTPGQTYVEVKEGEETEDVKITLGAGGRVEGTVRHRDGTPVAQALVQLFPTSFNDPTKPPNSGPPAAVTQADGSFAFEHVFPGAMNVILMTGQQGQYTNVDQSPVSVAEGETQSVALILKTTVVRGTVRRPSDPPGGLRVSMVGSNMVMMGGQMRLSSLIGDIPWTTAITEADGRFALKVVGPMATNTTVSPVDRQASLLVKKVDIPDQDEFSVTLDLAGTRVSGRVIDAVDSRAIGDATAAATRQPGPDDVYGPRSWYAKSDASGRFSFDLEAGEYDITVSSDGFVESAPRRVTVASSEMALDDIALTKGGSVSGRVTLRGQPVGQARVALSPRGQRGSQSRWTGPDGYFTLTGIPEDTVRLVATSEAGDAGFVGLAGVSTEPVEIKLGPGARINVTVIAPRDKLSTVDVTSPQIDGFSNTGWSRTDVNGRASLFGLPGETVVRASVDNLVGETVVRTLGGQTSEVVIELKPRSSSPKK